MIGIKKDIKASLIFVTLTIFICLIIYHSISFFTLIQPDSDSYLSFSSKYKALYPSLLNICNLLNINIVNVQILLLSISFTYLLFSLKDLQINKVFILLFLSFFLLNIYYTSFTKTILTESLFFSFINICLAILIKSQNKNFDNIILGISSGCIFAIKSVGPIISLPILAFFLYKIRRIDIKAIFFFIVIIITEIFIFNYKNTQRESVFRQSVIGKIFIISSSDNFIINDYPKKYHNIFQDSKLFFNEIKEFLKDIKNPFLKGELIADYEVVAQYQYKDFIRDESNLYLVEELKDENLKIFLDLLRFNHNELIQLSLSHYIGMWSVGQKYLAIQNQNIKFPMLKMLEKSSGPMHLSNSEVYKYVQAVFYIIFFTFLIFSILILFYKNIKNRNLIIFCFFTSHLYLFSTCFFNIASPRYLMPVLTLIIVGILLLIDALYKKLNKY